MPRNAGRQSWTWAAFAVLAAASLAAPAAAAELGPVGFEAVGVEVRAALRGGLDVRDAFNRPVARALVERQLAGSSAAADPGAALSRLPMIRALWSLLNRVLLGFGLRGGLPASSGSPAASWPWRLPELEAGVVLVLLVSLVLGPRTFLFRAACAARNCCPLVLRC